VPGRLQQRLEPRPEAVLEQAARHRIPPAARAALVRRAQLGAELGYDAGFRTALRGAAVRLEVTGACAPRPGRARRSARTPAPGAAGGHSS
jgi:hypothetical protein